MQRYMIYTLTLLLSSAHALFGCEPSTSVLDTTYGNAAQVNPGGDGSFTKLSDGISIFYPVTDVLLGKGVYDDATQRIISIGNKGIQNSWLMVTDTSGIITATTEVTAGSATILRDIALLTDSTTVVVVGNINDIAGSPCLIFLDQEGTNLGIESSSFGAVPGEKPMYAVEAVSTNTIVMGGQVESQFALAFFDYNGIQTQTVLTSFFTETSGIAVLAQLTDNSFVAGGNAGGNLALAKYDLDGNLLTSTMYVPADVLTSATFAVLTGLVPLVTGELLIGGVVQNPSTSFLNPFLARVDEDLENFTALQVITEMSTRNEVVKPSLVDTGTGYVIMTVPAASLFSPTTVVKLAYDGTYDTTFGSCRGSQVLPQQYVCFMRNQLTSCLSMVMVGNSSIAQPDGKIIILGGLIGSIPQEAVIVGASFKITGSSIVPSTDPLTVAIQRKYFGLNV